MKVKKTFLGNRIPALLMLMTSLCLLTITGCSSAKGDAAAVREDLESMRYVELDPETEAELKSILSDEGREFFEMFLAKAGEFDYEIIDSIKAETGDGTVVTVRIKTYDFASEYLRSWSDFLEETDAGKVTEDADSEESGETTESAVSEEPGETAENAAEEDAESAYDQAKLYETLFRNLSSTKDKDFITDVEIHCVETEDGTWQTDAKTSRAVKDAILGGMLSEIAVLAGAN